METSRSGVGSGGTGDNQGHNTSQTQVQPHVTVPPVTYQQRPNSLSACYASCCAESAKKVHFLITIICKKSLTPNNILKTTEGNRKCLYIHIYIWLKKILIFKY